MFWIFVVFYFDITHPVPTASYVVFFFFFLIPCLTSYVLPPLCVSVHVPVLVTVRACTCTCLHATLHDPPCCRGAPEEEGRPRRRRTPRFLLKP